MLTGKFNDFALVPELGMIIIIADHKIKAVTMDGSNEIPLFSVDALNLTSVLSLKYFFLLMKTFRLKCAFGLKSFLYLILLTQIKLL